MPLYEKRKFIRLEALHLLDYLILNKDGSSGTYSMGRTLDVSADGIKLETNQPIPYDTELLITLGIEDNLVDIIGRVTYCQTLKGRYNSGIVFLKIDKAARKIVTDYVTAFHERKNKIGAPAQD